jgi:hypothetical protein
MHDIMEASGVERTFIDREIKEAIAVAKVQDELLTDRQKDRVQVYAKKTLRGTVARMLSNDSHRDFSCRIAESSLLQWFCGCDSLDAIRVPSKSTLQRMESEVPTEVITALSGLLLENSTTVDHDEASTLGLRVAVDLSMIWMDSTCAKLDIHFPADWVLLRDATRSIMRAIMVSRKHGLNHRMPDPKSFVAEMNKLSMEMSGASRRGRGGDKKRGRKRTLRLMKQLVKKVSRHGKRYRDLLEKCWQDTDLSQAQARQIIDRLDRLLTALPLAIKQAHERIIGERVVPNDKKILSLYEMHAKVYVRGTAGADAEFGLQLLVGESAEGLIVDCLLKEDGIANDRTLLIPAVKRIRDAHGDKSASTIVGDRGFFSKKNTQELEDMDVTDATLPRSPKAMEEFLKDPGNRELHKRRAQTEVRIGILKSKFLGDHLPTKGFPDQRRYVAWAVLAHNLWVPARMEQSVAYLAKAG